MILEQSTTTLLFKNIFEIYKSFLLTPPVWVKKPRGQSWEVTSGIKILLLNQHLKTTVISKHLKEQQRCH